LKSKVFHGLIAVLTIFAIADLTSGTYFENVFALSEFDRDYDGIPDEFDKCPQLAETYNKFEDDDGCPDIAPEQSRYKHDADLDGIINDNDLCPMEPEDYDGNKDVDGCPDP